MKSNQKSNYKHTKIFKIFNPENPNILYLSTTGNQYIKPKTILNAKYRKNTENAKRGFKEFFKNKNLVCEYFDEMNLRTKAEVVPHLYLFCERLDPKYTVINKPNII
jgi:hypothetical protein